MRMAVVRHRGEPTHAVVCYNHLVLDGQGLDALTRDLAYLDREHRDPLEATHGLQPLDQAAFQGSPAGRKQSESALRYWHRLAACCPGAARPACARGLGRPEPPLLGGSHALVGRAPRPSDDRQTHGG